ncbi:MAG: hypothetical protein IBX39_08245 [Candidatus Methanoperedenaceae archaeon]|nr:hypothetical protein [Candidatus Methanoperedenaceae archaeon]
MFLLFCLTGAPHLVKLLTEGLTGVKLAVETGMAMAAKGIEEHIIKKRKALGI